MGHREFWVRWFDELWGKRNPGIIDECVSTDCRIDGLPDTLDGRASFHGFFRTFSAAFPTIQLKVEDCIENGEEFAFRCTGHVTTHDGRQHQLSGGCMGRIRNGQIVEAWNMWNFIALLGSMGVLEPTVLEKTVKSEGAKAR